MTHLIDIEKEDTQSPLYLLNEELKNDDIQIKLNVLRRLEVIAKSLGEEKSRNELIPFLLGTFIHVPHVFFHPFSDHFLIQNA